MLIIGVLNNVMRYKILSLLFALEDTLSLVLMYSKHSLNNLKLPSLKWLSKVPRRESTSLWQTHSLFTLLLVPTTAGTWKLSKSTCSPNFVYTDSLQVCKCKIIYSSTCRLYVV